MSDEIGHSDDVRHGRSRTRRMLAVTVSLLLIAVGAAIGLDRGSEADTLVRAAASSAPEPTAGEVDVRADVVRLDEPSIAGRSATPDSPAPDEPESRAPDGADETRGRTVPIDEPTQMIGISWVGSPGASIAWRALVNDRWTEWETVEDLPEEAPEDSPRSGVGPIYLDGDGATGLEIDLIDGPLEDLQIHRFRWDADADADAEVAAEEVPAARQTLAAPAAGRAPQPTIRARSAWISGGWAHGNDGCAGGPESVGRVRHAVVHHSAGGNTYAASEVPAIMKSIHLFHTSGRGWCDFGYNYAVDRFGGIWEGRTTVARGDVVGGHAIGFNSSSVGVVLLGQYQPGESPAVARPTAAALASLEALLAWKLSINDVDPTSTVRITSGHSGSRWPEGQTVSLPAISGHRDVGHTACPGQYLYEKLGSVRTGAKSRIPTTPTTTTTAPTTTPPRDGWWAPFRDVASFSERQATDFLGRSADATDRAATQREYERTGGSAGPILWFATRPTVAATTDPAIRMHLAWLDRPPTAEELETRRDDLRSGTALDVVLRQLLADHGSDEVSDTEFVERIHANVTGGTIDGPTRTALLDRLASGTARETILGEYLADPAFIAETEPLVRVVVVHHSMLGTVPESSELPDLVDATAPAVAADILTSSDYRTRIGATP